jgi:ATP-binding cassette subfamily D (ALD) protein 4
MLLLALIVGASTCKSGMEWAGGWLALVMRRSLTVQLHSDLLKNLYDLKSVDLDNPDQRITQDVDKLALAVGYILEKIVISPLLMVYYTVQLVQIDGWNAPLCLLAFFIVSMLISRVLIGPMARIIFKKEEKEGDLRYVHLRLLNSVDQVCFLTGQNAEKKVLDSKLVDLLIYQKYLIYWQMLMSFFTGTLDYLGTLISYTVVAVPIFMGSVEPDA